MSSCPGYTLEDLIDWEYGYTTPELIALYEEHRNSIEDWLLAFDEQETGWRTYASYWLDMFPVDKVKLKEALTFKKETS